jgi:hypothetical protein
VQPACISVELTHAAAKCIHCTVMHVPFLAVQLVSPGQRSWLVAHWRLHLAWGCWGQLLLVCWGLL